MPGFVPSFPLLLFSLVLLRSGTIFRIYSKVGRGRGKQIEAALTRGTSQKMTTNSSTFFTTIYTCSRNNQPLLGTAKFSLFGGRKKSIFFFPRWRRRGEELKDGNQRCLARPFSLKKHEDRRKELWAEQKSKNYACYHQQVHLNLLLLLRPEFLIYLGR